MYKISVPVVINNPDFCKEQVLDKLKLMKAHRIALAVSRDVNYAFSSPDIIQKLKQLIEYYEVNDLETLVWLGETMGHDPHGNYGDKYTTMVKSDGTKIASFCPFDKNFIKDVCNWVKDVATAGAKMIMLDDDFRFGLRGDGSIECLCDLHMERINKLLGENLSREQFAQKAFSGGKNKYRDAYLKANGDALREISYAMRETLDKINPDIRLGFCCAPNAWDLNGASPLEIAKIMAGKTKPFVRLCGAPYWSWVKPSHVAEYVRLQSKLLENEDIEFFAEGDTYPRPRFATPESYLECFDQIVRASGKTDGILKYALDYASSTSYEPGYVESHIKNKKLYDDINKLFDGKKSIGVVPVNPVNIAENMDITGASDIDYIQHNLFGGRANCSIDFAIKNSLPTTYDGNGFHIVFGEAAKHVDKTMLKNGAIIDISAAAILIEKGIDVGIENIEYSSVSGKRSFEDVPAERFIEYGDKVRLEFFEDVIITYKENAKIVSEIIKGENIFPGAAEYSNGDMSFIILPVDAKNAPFGFFESYLRRKSIVDGIERLGGYKVPVDLCGKYPYMYMMLKEDESAYALGLWNIFADKAENVNIKINGEYSKVNFINCKGMVINDRVVIDAIYPFEFAGIEIVK